MQATERSLFGSGLAKSIVLLRYGGFIGPKSFPIFFTSFKPVLVMSRGPKGVKIPRLRFIVGFEVEKEFDPQRMYLRFDRRGNSIYLSSDQIDWYCINTLIAFAEIL